MALFGCDLSDFDRGRGPVDVGAMARDGISFLTHKATEGTKVQHAYYGQTLNQARIDGIPFLGAYMVPRTPGNNGHGSIEQQVSYFLAYLDGQTPWWRTHPGFFIQVDLEHWSDSNGVVYDAVAPQHGVLACQLLRSKTGRWVVLYAPRWAYGDTIPGDDPLWASSYGTNPATAYRNAYPGDGSSGWAPYSGRTPVFLQYGSRLTIGSQPTCDANAFRGTVDQLRALITGGNVALTPDDITAIKIAVNGGPGSLTIDQLQQWLGDGLDSRGGSAHPIAPRSSMALILQRLETLNTQATGQPTQTMVDAAMLKALQDPAVINALGAAVASHIHVS